MSFNAVRLQPMLQSSSQGSYPFVYFQCPALAFYGSLTGYWATCLAGYISGDNSQFSWHSASVLLKCSRSQLSVDQSFINFPSLTGSLTGTKPACFFGGFRSRSTSCSRSLFCLASVLLPCSLCQLCVVRVLLISFPSLTGTKPACLFGGFRSRSTSYSSFSFCLASVLLPCSLCQLYVVRVLLISFPRITGSLTGTKPACLTG